MENIQSVVSKYSPYISEIRKRIFFTLFVFVAAMLVGFIFNEKIIRFLIDLLSLKGVNIVFTSPFQFVNLAISCAVTTGLISAFPLLVYQLLSFLKPALRKGEFKMLIGFLPFSLLLFLSGFSFGFLIMKWQIEIFLNQATSLGIGNILDISRLISTVLIVSALMGVAFQFPVIMFLLMRIGVIKHKQLAKLRLWVYLGSFIFAVLLPPDSIIADFFLSLPLIILFEFTLILNRIFDRRNPK
mgnify:CR=1 FL=1